MIASVRSDHSIWLGKRDGFMDPPPYSLRFYTQIQMGRERHFLQWYSHWERGAYYRKQLDEMGWFTYTESMRQKGGCTGKGGKLVKRDRGPERAMVVNVIKKYCAHAWKSQQNPSLSMRICWEKRFKRFILRATFWHFFSISREEEIKDVLESSSTELISWICVGAYPQLCSSVWYQGKLQPIPDCFLVDSRNWNLNWDSFFYLNADVTCHLKEKESFFEWNTKGRIIYRNAPSPQGRAFPCAISNVLRNNFTTLFYLFHLYTLQPYGTKYKSSFQ